MKRFRLFTLLLASVATLAFCSCGEDNGPAIKHEVSRMNHFARLDISSDMLAIVSVLIYMARRRVMSFMVLIRFLSMILGDLTLE